MSKSLTRVITALNDAGLAITPLEMSADTRTAAQAAAAAGCAIDQIAKSIIFRGETSGTAILFLTAGGQQVDPGLAAALAGEPLGKADAALIRTRTGFAIGGVAPVGHLTPIPAFMDSHLLAYDQVWAAAATPRHIFPISAAVLLRITGATMANFTV